MSCWARKLKHFLKTNSHELEVQISQYAWAMTQPSPVMSSCHKSKAIWIKRCKSKAIWIKRHKSKPSGSRDTNPKPSGSRDRQRVSPVLWCHWLTSSLSPVIGQCITMSQDQSGCTADPINIFENLSDCNICGKFFQFWQISQETTVSVTVTSVDNVSILVTYVDNVSVLTTQWGCTNVPSTLTFVSLCSVENVTVTVNKSENTNVTYYSTQNGKVDTLVKGQLSTVQLSTSNSPWLSQGWIPGSLQFVCTLNTRGNNLSGNLIRSLFFCP